MLCHFSSFLYFSWFFFPHQTEASLSPRWASDSSLYKAQSRSISVIHRLPSSSIIHARRCWTDWIVTTLVGGGVEGGRMEGGWRRPLSVAAGGRKGGGGRGGGGGKGEEEECCSHWMAATATVNTTLILDLGDPKDPQPVCVWVSDFWLTQIWQILFMSKQHINRFYFSNLQIN